MEEFEQYRPVAEEEKPAKPAKPRKTEEEKALEKVYEILQKEPGGNSIVNKIKKMLT